VAGVLGRLGDDVQDRTPRAPNLPGLEPWCGRQRLAGVEVGQRGDQLVGAGGDLGIPGEQLLERLHLGHPVAVGPGRDLRRRVAPVHVRPVDVGGRRRPVDDEVGPGPLGVRDVLDQAAEGQLAHSRASPGLLVGDAPHGEAEEVAVPAQALDEVSALAGQLGGGLLGGGLLGLLRLLGVRHAARLAILPVRS